MRMKQRIAALGLSVALAGVGFAALGAAQASATGSWPTDLTNGFCSTSLNAYGTGSTKCSARYAVDNQNYTFTESLTNSCPRMGTEMDIEWTDLIVSHVNQGMISLNVFYA
jgi:hypothetical protein